MKTLNLSLRSVALVTLCCYSSLFSSHYQHSYEQWPRQPIPPASMSTTTSTVSTEDRTGLYPSHELPQSYEQQPYRSGYVWPQGSGIPQPQPYMPQASQPVPCPQTTAYASYPSHPYPTSPLGQNVFGSSAPTVHYRVHSETPPTPDSGFDQRQESLKKGHYRNRSGSMPDLGQVSISEQSLADGTDTDTEEATTKKYAAMSGDRALEILQEQKTACLAALTELSRIITYQSDTQALLWENANKKARTTSPTARHSSLSRMFDLVTSKEKKATKAQTEKLEHFNREMRPIQEGVLHTAALFDMIVQTAQKYQAKLSDTPTQS